jgi:hypothetical protein
MENQPNQPSKPANKSLWIVLVIVILALAGYGIYAYVSGNTNNANTTSNINSTINTNVAENSNSVGNINTTPTISGPTTYENSVIPFTLGIPASATVREQHVSSNIVNGIAYPSFTLAIMDSRVSGELIISNRATGFENEQTTSETQGQVDGKPVRIIESTRINTNSTPEKMIRYLFSPLNSGTMYEEMWISYPTDTQAQIQVFQSIVNNIKFK